MIVEYLDLGELHGLDESFLYQILVFVADVKDEVVLFQSENKMVSIPFPVRLREGLQNAKCELVLLNGIKVKNCVIQITRHTTMIRVLDRSNHENQSGFSICKTKSFPRGDYLNWPRDYDNEAKKSLQKVYPFVGRFFERCTQLYMKPIGEFKCCNQMDSFLYVRSIFNRWARWDQSTKELLQAGPSKSENEKEETSMITINVAEEGQVHKKNLKRELESDEEPIRRKIRKTSSSGSDESHSRKVATISLLSSSEDESTDHDSPTTSDENFICDDPVTQDGIRPKINFSEDQRREFERALSYYENCSEEDWKPFRYKYLTAQDVVKIVCQTLTNVTQGQITALENFLVEGQLNVGDEILALLSQMKKTPPNYEY